MNGLKLRSSQGCWTCRLRRKKCDEARPICAACGGLEIDCHYSDIKPEWMDGGAREKQMADELKVMVKRKANERRERKWGQLPTMADLSPSAQTHQEEHQSSDRVMRDADGPTPSDDGSGDGTSSSSTTTVPSSTPPSQAETSNTSSEPSPPSSGSQHSAWGGPPIQPAVDAFPENKSEVEVNFTMIYLDYVVPFLFPFYRPCILESSRGWMLVQLMKNRTLFHTALSLANWLYAVLFDATDGAHGDCKRANWAELQAHQEIAIQALQEDIKALNERGVANAFRECISCMQSVVQLLEFEVVMANTANWQVHHDAAVALFDQLMTHHGTTTTDGDGAVTTTTAPWSALLDRIGFPFRTIWLAEGRRVLTSDQSAYKFYTAYLLWVDIVAATTNGSAPRLQRYHAELLHGDPPTIRLSDYVGCHSWAVLELAEVARLAAWKREQQSGGSLSMVELVRRACTIDRRLRQRMATLVAPAAATATAAADRASNIYDPSAHHPIAPYSGFHEMVAESEARNTAAADLHTRIWAQATVTYLHVIASGLQPTLPEIQASVRETIELFRALPSPLAVRTLVWPFAVTGCLALQEQEPFFVEFVDRMGTMQIFGTVKEALSIMQLVWKHKDSCCADPQMWDIATCFSLLGHRSLLV